MRTERVYILFKRSPALNLKCGSHVKSECMWKIIVCKICLVHECVTREKKIQETRNFSLANDLDKLENDWHMTSPQIRNKQTGARCHPSPILPSIPPKNCLTYAGCTWAPIWGVELGIWKVSRPGTGRQKLRVMLNWNGRWLCQKWNASVPFQSDLCMLN